ncbi:hypothetical protein [Tenacibaculum sp.]|uniref:hypothetical protein n=1 Tax=Tenacibaculum sp. TaxID=1906242 RepID=UPI003AA8FDA1
MNKKQKTYLLLAVVVCVWGLIGYKIYNRLSPNTTTIATTNNSNHFSRKKIVEVQPYTIRADYRDPFLGKLPIKRKKVSFKPKKKITGEKKNFPQIVYNGTVASNKSKSFIITINGEQEIFNLGQNVRGLTLVKGNSEEVLLKFQNETKTFKAR